MPNRRLLKFLAVLARYEVKDFVFTSLDAQLLACSARVSLKSDSLLAQVAPEPLLKLLFASIARVLPNALASVPASCSPCAEGSFS